MAESLSWSLILERVRLILVYDAGNRLVQVKQGSTVLASYTYDGDGTLVRKVAGDAAE